MAFWAGALSKESLVALAALHRCLLTMFSCALFEVPLGKRLVSLRCCGACSMQPGHRKRPGGNSKFDFLPTPMFTLKACFQGCPKQNML